MAIFGLWLACLVAIAITGGLIGALVGGVNAALGRMSQLGIAQLQYLLITPVSQTFTTLIGAAGTASVYYELRFIKEGIGPNALASVFD